MQCCWWAHAAPAAFTALSTAAIYLQLSLIKLICKQAAHFAAASHKQSSASISTGRTCAYVNMGAKQLCLYASAACLKSASQIVISMTIQGHSKPQSMVCLM